MSNLDDYPWLADMRALIESLVAAEIVDFYWTEEAIAWDESDSIPVLFRHPQFPFIQTCDLRIKLADGRVGCFDTYQADDAFGLWFFYDDKPLVRASCPASARAVTDHSFPVGSISKVEIKVSEKGNIDELLFDIDSKQILLKAGEVYESHDRTFWAADEESLVLVFPQPEDVTKVRFGELTKPLEA